MLNVRSVTAAAALLCALAPIAAVAADPFALESDGAIKQAADALAADVIQQFKSAESKQHPGLMNTSADHIEYTFGDAALLWYSMIEYGYHTGNDTYNELAIDALTSQNSKNAFKSPQQIESYDPVYDQLLWGMASIAAAERGLASKYKDQSPWVSYADTVFDSVMGKWDVKMCHGGLLNDEDSSDAKMTTNNGLMFNLAARLALFTSDKKYADGAIKIWNWLEESELVDKKYVVASALDGDEICTPGKMQTSLDNAVVTGGAAFMYNLTGDSAWKERVEGLIKDGLKRFTTGTILYDVVCEDERVGCPFDLMSYKNLFHQNYAVTAKLVPGTAKTIMPQLQTAAKAALKSCKGDGTFRNCDVDNLHNQDFHPAPNNRGILAQLDVLMSVSTLVSEAGLPLRAGDHGDASSKSSEQDSKAKDQFSKDSSANYRKRFEIWSVAAVAISLIAVTM